jgi:hypothetical protein
VLLGKAGTTSHANTLHVEIMHPGAALSYRETGPDQAQKETKFAQLSPTAPPHSN